MTTAAGKPLRIFCSYSHKDEEYLNELRDSLQTLERQGLIQLWHDREITAGKEWREVIDEELQGADIILLLVSRDFIASDFAYEEEMKRAIERHERGETCVIPLIVRPTPSLEGAPFKNIQSIPRDMTPVTAWDDRDKAWVNIEAEIRRVVEELLLKRKTQAPVEEGSIRLYREVAKTIWVDEELNMLEVQRLRDLANSLGLSSSTAAEVECEVMGDTKEALLEQEERKAKEERYREAVKKAWTDNELSKEEAQRLSTLASELGLSADTAADIEREVMDDTKEAILKDQKQNGGPSAEGPTDEGPDADFQFIRTIKLPYAWLTRVGGVGVDAVAFSPNGQLIASAFQSSVEMFDVEDGALVCSVPDGRSGVAFSPDGEVVASARADNVVGLWRVEDGTLVYTLEGHRKRVFDVAFSPDGQLVASCGGGLFGGDSVVRLWNLNVPDLYSTLEHRRTVSSVAFSPDGELLASGAWDNTVRLWTVWDGALIDALEGHTKKVNSVSFSPDGKLLASGADDGTVRLWGVGDELAKLALNEG